MPIQNQLTSRQSLQGLRTSLIVPLIDFEAAQKLILKQTPSQG
ncbi:MAG: hypothetical protein NTX02_11975 [Planctomycetia bacterium]|nr:hypothetical protein [Planctomycetia bacterium]